MQLFKVPSLPNLFKKSKDSDQEGSSTGAEDETSFGSEYSGGKRVSHSGFSLKNNKIKSPNNIQWLKYSEITALIRKSPLIIILSHTSLILFL